jgi:hypothetical protein
VAFLAAASFAPPVAQAGCSQHVIPQTDPGSLVTLFTPLMHDLSGRSQAPSAPADPRPCSGAFCSGQPAVPAVPAQVLDGVLDSWACLAAVAGLALTDAYFLSVETGDLHPTRRAIAVFHPPRLLSSA